MRDILERNNDLIAGYVRSQIGILQDLLYGLENNRLDGQMIRDRMRALNRCNIKTIDYCEAMQQLN